MIQGQENSTIEETDKKKIYELKELTFTKYFKNQIPPQLEDGEKWEDPLFPADETSLLTTDYLNKSLQEEQMQFVSKEIKPDQIEWRRLSDVNSNYKIFENVIEKEDIKQGGLSICYFLSALAALCEFPEFISQRFITRVVNLKCYYEILLFIDGEWQIVLIDDYFPYDRKNRNALQFTNIIDTEIWVILLEKAWAKVNGGYANIVLGRVSDAFQALTGFSNEVIEDFDKRTIDQLWDLLKTSDNTDYIMCTSTKNENHVGNHGLVKGHAYTVIAAKEGGTGIQNVKLLHLFNPWGMEEWKGEYSDTDTFWTEQMKKEFNKPEPTEGKTNDDGQFFIHVRDFVKYFDTLFVCQVLYGSTLIDYTIPYEHGKKPLVFSFDIEEDCNVTFSVFFKHWRYNRHLKNINRPFSLVYARLVGEDVEFLNGKYTQSDDLNVNTRLIKGKYIVWMYSLSEGDLEENFTYHFRFAAEHNIRINYVGDDTNFEVLRFLLLSYRINKMNNDPTAYKTKEVKLNQDKELLDAGIQSYYVMNLTPNQRTVKLDVVDLREIRIISTNIENNSIEKSLNPGEELIVLFGKLGKDEYFGIRPTIKDPVIVGGAKVNKNSKSKNAKKVVVAADEVKVEEAKVKVTLPEMLNITEDSFKFEKVEYKFASVVDLKYKNQYEKAGENVKEFYDKNDLLNSNYFAANEVFRLLEEKGNSNAVLTIEGKSTYTYLGQKKPQEKGQIYYGAQISRTKGDIYIGAFRDGLFSMKGKHYRKDQVLIYSGEYREGMKHGKGIYFSEDRNIFRGVFKEDHRKGLFRIYHENTNSLTIGFMDNDKMEGYALEVNYPHRNTRIAYYQNGSLLNFLVVEYKFFKDTFNLERFLNEPNYHLEFTFKVSERFPMKETTDLLLRRIWTERSENEQCRMKDPFMYDMLRELSYSFITKIIQTDIIPHNYGTSYQQLFDKQNPDNDYMMITWEKTDKAYYLSKHRVYIFFLGITNEKPLYDKNVRWLLFSEDHSLIYEGGYDHLHNCKFYKTNGEFLHALVTGKAYYFFPERGIAYGDYSFEDKPLFSLYNFYGFWNNYIHIRLVTKSEDSNSKDSESSKKRYDMFIPKKEVQDIHMERLLLPSDNQKLYKTLVNYVNKNYPWLYVLPTGKAGEDNEDLSFFRFEIEDNKVSLSHYGLPIYSVYRDEKNLSVQKTIEVKSQVYEKYIGRMTMSENNYQYLGAIRDDKRHGRGVEMSKVNNEDKTVHMTFNEDEKDGYNLEFNGKDLVEAYYFNDGIRCSESLNLVIYDKANLIGNEESLENRSQRREEENKDNFNDLREQFGEKFGVLLDLVENFPKTDTPYLIWSWKYTIDGIYIGEVDPFYQSCGRGILLYNNHSMNQGAYVGHWTAGIREGQGIHVSLTKKTYYSCRYSLNEMEINIPIPINQNQLNFLNEFMEDEPRDFTEQMECEDLIENDTEDRLPRVLSEDVQTVQWFANRIDDILEPNVEDMKKHFEKVDELRKLFVIE